MRIDRILDPQRLQQATLLVMQRHSVLRSRIKVDLAFPEKYFWSEIDETNLKAPLIFKELSCSEPDLDHELNASDRYYNNQVIHLESTYPFKLVCIFWTQGLTHLQFVSSHVACDGMSMFIFFTDLFRYYSELEAGEQPLVDPLPYLYDWKSLFGIGFTYQAKRATQSPILMQYRLQLQRNAQRYGDERDWQDLLQVAEAKKAKQQESWDADQEANILVAFPRLAPIEQIKDLDPHLAPIWFRYFEFTEAQSDGLRNFAKAHESSVHEVLNLAYLKCQIDMAEAHNEIVELINLYYPLNTRTLAKDPRAQYSMGNFISLQNYRFKCQGSQEDITSFLKKINIQTHYTDNSTAQEEEWLTLMKAALLKTIYQEAVRGEDWRIFLSLFLNQTQPYFRNITTILTTNVGIVDRHLKSNLNVVAIRSIPLTRRYYLGMSIFKRKILLTASYIPDLLVSEHIDEVWQRTIHYLTTFAQF